MTERRHYTKEFKLDAVSLVINHGYSCAEAARSLGIRANMLWRWVREFNQDDGHAFRGHGKMTPEQEELRRLREEVRSLKMDNDILRKAKDFFAKGTQ